MKQSDMLVATPQSMSIQNQEFNSLRFENNGLHIEINKQGFFVNEKLVTENSSMYDAFVRFLYSDRPAGLAQIALDKNIDLASKLDVLFSKNNRLLNVVTKLNEYVNLMYQEGRIDLADLESIKKISTKAFCER